MFDKDSYPDNWNEIRHEILCRDKYKCCICSIPHRSYALIQSPGQWISISKSEASHLSSRGLKVVRVFLQCSHINNIKSDCTPSNLRSLCPVCHLTIDQEFKKLKRISGPAPAQNKI